VVNTKVAHTYARALFAVAEEAGALDTLEEELRELRQFAAAQPELLGAFRAFLEHPRLTAATKKEVLARALGPQFSALTLDFLSLMIDKKRAGLILPALEEFEKLLDESRGIQRAEVRSAVPLPEDLTEALNRQLEALTGKTILLTKVVEEDLLGGLVVHVGGRLIDGSLRSQLDALRDRWRQARVVEAA